MGSLTCVPCLTKLYSLPDAPTLPRPVLKDLLEFAMRKNHFIFDGQYYDQIDGVSMGSHIDPVLAGWLIISFNGPFGLNTWMTLSPLTPYLTVKTPGLDT